MEPVYCPAAVSDFTSLLCGISAAGVCGVDAAAAVVVASLAVVAASWPAAGFSAT